MNRLQQLAGILTEAQLNEDILELKQMSKQLYSFLKKKGFDVEITNKIKVPLRPENPKGGTMTIDKSSVRSTPHGMPVQIQVFEGTEEMVVVGVTPDNVAKVLVGGGTTGEDRWSYKAEKRFGNDWGAWQKNPEIMKYVNNLGNEMLAQIKERYPNMVYKFDQENFLYLLYFGYAQTKKGGQKNLSQRPNAPKPAAQPQAESLDIEEIVNEALKSIKEATPAAPTNAPSDVKALGKAQATSSTVASRAKAINSIQEFPGAFENWFKTLGFQPGKISKSAVRTEVEKVLTKLGYK